MDWGSQGIKYNDFNPYKAAFEAAGKVLQNIRGTFKLPIDCDDMEIYNRVGDAYDALIRMKHLREIPPGAALVKSVKGHWELWIPLISDKTGKIKLTNIVGVPTLEELADVAAKQVELAT